MTTTDMDGAEWNRGEWLTISKPPGGTLKASHVEGCTVFVGDDPVARLANTERVPFFTPFLMLLMALNVAACLIKMDWNGMFWFLFGVWTVWATHSRTVMLAEKRRREVGDA
jgi:hypothetical protein